MKYILPNILLLFLLVNISIAGDGKKIKKKYNDKLKLDGKFTTRSNSDTKDVKIIVIDVLSKDTVYVDKYSERFHLEVDLNKEYYVYFKKQGCITKFIELNTLRASGKHTFYLNVELVELTDSLIETPILAGKVSYSKVERKFKQLDNLD